MRNSRLAGGGPRVSAVWQASPASAVRPSLLSRADPVVEGAMLMLGLTNPVAVEGEARR